MEAIQKRRSIRKFKDAPVSYDVLKELINAARLAPSGANRQPLEFLLVDDTKTVRKIFDHVHWAGYLDWAPTIEERPRAYIFVLIHKENQKGTYKYDVGLATENICLSAVAQGLGTCILAAIDRDAIRSLLQIPGTIKIELGIAIGVPDQEAIVEEVKEEDIEYWRDEEGVFHVPKRSVDDILHRNRFRS